MLITTTTTMLSPLWPVAVAVVALVVLAHVGTAAPISFVRDARGEPQAVHTFELTSYTRLARAKQTSTKRAPVVDALTGCTSTGFSTPVTIGNGKAAQVFNLNVDTGSSTLAVAGDDCSNCGVTSTYTTLLHAANGAVNTGQTVSSTYGDGSGWSGTVWADTVSIGSISLPNMRIAVQSSQNNFYNNWCGSGSSMPINQGIMGMAYQNLAMYGTDAFPDEWERVNQGTGAGQGAPTPKSLVFAIRMCAILGTLWINGVDSSSYTSAPVYTPLTLDLYYNINVNGLRFTDSSGMSTWHTSASSSSSFNNPIVDSGTTLFMVPQTVFNDMNTYLNSNSAFVSIFGTDFITKSTCPYIGQSIASLNSQLPWLRLDLDDGVSLVMPAISSYIQQYQQNGLTYLCSGVAPGGSTILGWSVMNNYVVVFDRTNTHFPKGAIGWAPTSSCNTGTVARVLGGSKATSAPPTTTNPPTNAPATC